MATPTGWYSGYGHFAVYGSNDNSSWVFIESFTEPTQDHQADGELGFDLVFSSAPAYRYFKIVADNSDIRTDTNAGGSVLVYLGGISYGGAAPDVAPLTEVDSLSSTITSSVFVGSPFKESSSFSSHSLYGMAIDNTEFIESGTLTSSVYAAYIAKGEPFVESDFLSSSVRIRIHSVIAVTNKLLVGAICAIVNALDMAFNLVSWNSIDSELNSSIAFTNVLSEAQVHSIMAFVNRLETVDKITSTIAITNAVGESDLKARHSFWGQGPVVHREGSHGGYE